MAKKKGKKSPPRGNEGLEALSQSKITRAFKPKDKEETKDQEETIMFEKESTNANNETENTERNEDKDPRDTPDTANHTEDKDSRDTPDTANPNPARETEEDAESKNSTDNPEENKQTESETASQKDSIQDSNIAQAKPKQDANEEQTKPDSILKTKTQPIFTHNIIPRGKEVTNTYYTITRQVKVDDIHPFLGFSKEDQEKSTSLHGVNQTISSYMRKMMQEQDPDKYDPRNTEITPATWTEFFRDALRTDHEIWKDNNQAKRATK